MKLDSDLEPQYTVMYANPQYTVMYADPKHCIYDVKNGEDNIYYVVTCRT